MRIFATTARYIRIGFVCASTAAFFLVVVSYIVRGTLENGLDIDIPGPGNRSLWISANCDVLMVSFSMFHDRLTGKQYFERRYSVLGIDYSGTRIRQCGGCGIEHHFLDIPIWMPLLVFSLGPAFLLLRRPAARRAQRRRHGLCVNCGYDLTGNQSGICPECGTKFREPNAGTPFGS